MLEANGVGTGTSGFTTGKVTSQHGLVYASMVKRSGAEAAQAYAEAKQVGLELIARLASEHTIDCELTRAPAVVYASDSAGVEQIEAEAETAHQLGLPATLTHEIDLPVPIAAALRFEDQLHVHPAKYLTGLAQALCEAGGVITRTPG